MKIHLVDGTYELFRNFYGPPGAKAPDGREVGAVRGLLRTLVALLKEDGVTHVGVAFDHVIESFRNRLYAGYKTGAGIEPDLYAQFPLAERAVRALGIVVWPMVDHEADDAIATAAARFAAAPEVEQVLVCSPDKDFAQCVRGRRVVLYDRRRGLIIDEDGVRAKWGVNPGSIPDWLALVGDAADGLPGIPRWGARSAAAVLARWGSIERIPLDPDSWDIKVRGAKALCESLRDRRPEALLFRLLATLATDAPVPEALDELRWRGPNEVEMAALAADIGAANLPEPPPVRGA